MDVWDVPVQLLANRESIISAIKRCITSSQKRAKHVGIRGEDESNLGCTGITQEIEDREKRIYVGKE
jgi:hypothetical protein